MVFFSWQTRSSPVKQQINGDVDTNCDCLCECMTLWFWWLDELQKKLPSGKQVKPLKKSRQREGFAEKVKTGGKQGQWRGNGGEQGTGLTYMRRVGLQGGDTLLWVGTVPFGEIGLQAWAGLIHRHGPTGLRGLPAFRGRGAGGVGVVWTARGLIDIGGDVPPERGVLGLQRLQLEETVGNTPRGALSKASCVPQTLQHSVSGSALLLLKSYGLCFDCLILLACL